MDEHMELGRFSISLAVQDIGASLRFYEKLGFSVIDGGHIHPEWPDAGDGSTAWRILQNGQAVIGLFQGLFDTNTLTFNPQDARQIQRRLKSRAVPIIQEADEQSQGPAALFLMDPDGNPILIDQLG